MDIPWRVFHILTKPVPYKMCVRTSSFRRLRPIRIQTYRLRNRGSAKIWKTRHETSVDIRIFFTVYCAIDVRWCYACRCTCGRCATRTAISRVGLPAGRPQRLRLLPLTRGGRHLYRLPAVAGQTSGSRLQQHLSHSAVP